MRIFNVVFVDSYDMVRVAMAGYTKLFNSILASTVWREDMPTRIVWITLLAMADKYGIAEASVPGLADFARVGIEDCRRALAVLHAPDPDSRSQEHEGRRIETVDGGWRLLNHAKYRAKLGADERREYLRQKQADYRQRKAEASTPSTSVSEVSDTLTPSTHAEAEAYTDTEAKADAEATSDAHAEARAPEWRQSSTRSSSLVGSHLRCFELAADACGRGLCVPAFLGQQWRQQLQGDPNADAWIQAFVRAEIARLPPGGLGDDPLKFWRAAWSARHGSQAPAPAPMASGRETAAAYSQRSAQIVLDALNDAEEQSGRRLK